jgi:dTDP-4-amino-4,6-dideoxygalactose transaminase
MHSAINTEMHNAFSRVYQSNWFVLGEELRAFEASYAEMNSIPYTVGVSNGLDALVIALRSLGVSKGDEVIVPSNTYIASCIAVSALGATPVLVEPNIATYNLDPSLIEAAVTKKTKAILPVHLYGQACEMEAIMQIAEEHKIWVVEDNAQAHLATFNGKLTGTFGAINGVSFYPGKNLGALGDGGAITTNSEALAEKARVLRNYGSNKKYFNQYISGNMRLDEIQAAFLSVKLKYLPSWTTQRQELASLYTERLIGVGDLVLPYVHPKASHSYHLYVVRTKFRAALQEFLNDKGIGTLIHYPLPIHRQKAYENERLKYHKVAIAETLSSSVLSLPLWVGMTVLEVDAVCDAITSFFSSGT